MIYLVSGFAVGLFLAIWGMESPNFRQALAFVLVAVPLVWLCGLIMALLLWAVSC